MQFAMWDLSKQLRITNYKLRLNVIRNLLFAICIVILIAPCSKLFAQSFSASVDKNVVQQGEQFTLTLSLEGSTNAGNLKLPDMPNFMVLSGPNQSTNMQWVNGQVSQSVSFSYILQPRDVGKFTIPSA